MKAAKLSCGLAIMKADKGIRKVLLIQSGFNQPWGFPKGKIEKSETEQECAIREVKEELGLKFKSSDFLMSTRYVQYNKRKDIVIFTVSGFGIGPADIKPKMGEIASFRWFSLADLSRASHLGIELCENQEAIFKDIIADLV